MYTHPALATAPLALQALANHIVAAGLPTPASITPPDESHPDLVIWVRHDHVALWLRSGFERLEVQPAPRPPMSKDRTTVQIDGTIPSPIGRVRIRLTYVELVPRRMHLVAGSAS